MSWVMTTEMVEEAGRRRLCVYIGQLHIADILLIPADVGWAWMLVDKTNRRSMHKKLSDAMKAMHAMLREPRTELSADKGEGA